VTISGQTAVAALIGSPVAHSLSPAIHNAAFAAAGLDWVYVAFDVAPGRASAALDAMRTLGLGGLSVTMPHKDAVFAAVDELDPGAATLGSVNTVVRRPDGRLVGHSTDGDGFVASLRADAGFDPDGARVVVLGAGGAARSVVEALARHGAGEVVVVNRTRERGEQAAALAGARGRVGAPECVAEADLVVNATSIGMGEPATSGTLPCDPAWLHPGQLVADLVYHPLETSLLAAARARGARVLDGLGMLVHQAVLQQVLWTGQRPDPDVMRAAAERQLARQS
jgi:shikimate dehydrogenase